MELVFREKNQKQDGYEGTSRTWTSKHTDTGAGTKEHKPNKQ